MTLAEKLIKDWWVQKTWGDNIERQQKARRLIDYYNGDQLEWLSLVMKAQFSDSDALRLQLGLDNITQIIADKISRVFDSPPVLTCDAPAGQALIDDLTADGKFALILKTAEVYTNLACISALHPWFDDKAKKIKTRLMPCYSLWVIQSEDDPTEHDAVIYSQSQSNTVTPELTLNYTYWDAETTRRFNTDGVDLIPPTPNIYRLVPFAFLRDQIPVDTFFTEIGDTLVTAQDQLNVMLTELNQLIKMQSFSQPVFVGLDDPKSQIVVDPSRPIKMPRSQRDETQPDFKFVTPSARITEVMAAIKDHVQRTCDRWDIHTDLLASGNIISGFALKLTESGLNRRRVDQLPLARECLQQWWTIVKAINNYHFPGKPVPPDAEMKIDFAEVRYDEDPATVDASDKAKVDMGIISPVDVIMRYNPDLDEEAATAVYNKNMTLKQTNQKRYGLADILTAGATPPRKITPPTKTGA